jgi:FkbM family methyltransferase
MSDEKSALENSGELEAISIPYIESTKINISKRSLELNKHTWTDAGVYQKNVVEFFSREIRGSACSFNPSAISQGARENEVPPKKPSAIVLDIGAQSGAFSLLAKYHPDTKWFCFECDPTNYSLLQENIKLNNINNCSTFQLALSNQNEKTTLHRSDHFGLHTLGSNPIRFRDEPSRNIEVETTSIDEFVATHNLPSVDFIKIDTEGCELNILRGAIKTIAKFKPKILFEYCEENLQQFDYSSAQLIRFVTDDLSYVPTNKLEDNIYAEFRGAVLQGAVPAPSTPRSFH